MRNLKSTILYEWFDEVWNNANENAIEKMMTDDCYAHGILDENQPGGIEGFKIFFKNFKSQFHDIKIDIDDVISQDNIESARTTVHAVHTLTGKNVTFSGICMAQIKDGKISEAWNNYDFLSMHQQLGQNLTNVNQS